MERFTLRILVIVLLGTTLGFWAMAHSHVMTQLPPQKHDPTLLEVQTPPTPPSAPASTGVPAPTGVAAPTGVPTAPASTGAAAPTGEPVKVVNPPVQPKGPEAAGATSDYFISLDQAKKLWDTKKYGDKDVIFIDAREYIEYVEGHIAGAMSCPKRRFDGAVPKYVREYLPGNAVVVYCHGELCTDSEAVVMRLIALKMDIGPYFIIKDGLPGWEKAGYPVNKGDNEGFVN